MCEHQLQFIVVNRGSMPEAVYTNYHCFFLENNKSGKQKRKQRTWKKDFDVSLTVHLSIILLINQHNAQILVL